MDISKAKNIGPISSKALREIGINTLEDLKSVGWKGAILKLTAESMQYANLNMARALIGALENKDFRDISTEQLQQARLLIEELKNHSIR